MQRAPNNLVPKSIRDMSLKYGSIPSFTICRKHSIMCLHIDNKTKGLGKLTQAAALELYVSEEGSQYNKHDAGYSSLLYSKRAFVELLRSFVGRDWVEKLDENSIIRVDKKYVLT
jgi:hypothetical protein